ncbi:MAG: CoA pyrophosphatase [Saprospiraceae bacterium]
MSFPEPFSDFLAERLLHPLPGQPAQYKMASLRRVEELGLRSTPPPDVKTAAVLLLLFTQQGTWHLSLIQRTVNLKDRHSGQISFPGGRYEPADGSLANAALREAHEEMGILPERVRLLGALTTLYVPVSNFVVHPFVGVINDGEPPDFVPQPGEVAIILTPPLEIFLNEQNRKMTDMTIAEGITLRNVPYFEVEDRVLWGATAMMLNEFLEVLTESK